MRRQTPREGAGALLDCQGARSSLLLGDPFRAIATNKCKPTRVASAREAYCERQLMLGQMYSDFERSGVAVRRSAQDRELAMDEDMEN